MATRTCGRVPCLRCVALQRRNSNMSLPKSATSRPGLVPEVAGRQYPRARWVFSERTSRRSPRFWCSARRFKHSRSLGPVPVEWEEARRLLSLRRRHSRDSKSVSLGSPEPNLQLAPVHICVYLGDMKRRDLERRLRELGWTLQRHGGKHDVWISPDGSFSEYVPRHPDVNERLARAILRRAEEKR